MGDAEFAQASDDAKLICLFRAFDLRLEVTQFLGVR